MIKLFVSQPMRGRSDEEIAAEREYAKAAAERILNEDVEVIDSFFQGGDMKPLEYLGESLKLLAGADWVWFCDGWDEARGCKIENTCAREYGISILHS